MFKVTSPNTMMLRYAKFRVQFPIFSQDSAGIRDDTHVRKLARGLATLAHGATSSHLQQK